MVKTLEYAAKKWAEKTPRAAPIWKKAVEFAKEHDNYKKGMEAFIGGPVNPVLVENWKKGIETISTEDFKRAVENAAKLDKYKQGILRKVAAM